MIKTLSVGTRVQHLDSLIPGEIIEIVSSYGWEVVDILWERPFFGKLITTELTSELFEYES